MSKEFFQKLSQVQVRAKCPKNQYNDFGKYSYRSCEDIMEGIKPLLAELGLVLSVTDEILQIGDRYYIKAISTITDGTNSHSVAGYAREAESKKGMDASQVTGATSSYARKYSLQGLLALDDNKDADAINYGQDNGSKSKKDNGSSPSAGNSRNSGKSGGEVPQVAGVNFEEFTGNDGVVYLIAKGDTFNKKSQLEKLGFKKRKDQSGNWVVYRPKYPHAV